MNTTVANERPDQFPTTPHSELARIQQGKATNEERERLQNHYANALWAQSRRTYGRIVHVPGRTCDKDDFGQDVILWFMETTRDPQASFKGYRKGEGKFRKYLCGMIFKKALKVCSLHARDQNRQQQLAARALANPATEAAQTNTSTLQEANELSSRALEEVQSRASDPEKSLLAALSEFSELPEDGRGEWTVNQFAAARLGCTSERVRQMRHRLMLKITLVRDRLAQEMARR